MMNEPTNESPRPIPTWNDRERLKANLQSLLINFYEYSHWLFPYKPGVPFADQVYDLQDTPFYVPLLSSVYRVISDPLYANGPEHLILPQCHDQLIWLKHNYDRILNHGGSPKFYRCGKYGKLDRTGALPPIGEEPTLEPTLGITQKMIKDAMKEAVKEIRGVRVLRAEIEGK